MMQHTLISTLTLVFLAMATSGNEPGPPRINARLAIDFPTDIRVNEPFEVVFTFETLEPLCIEATHPDSAILKVRGDAEYVSGDTVWTGHLSVGRPVRLAAIYTIPEPRPCAFVGRVYTRGPMPPPNNCNDDPRGYEHINGLVSRAISFPELEKTSAPAAADTTATGAVIREITLNLPGPLPHARVLVEGENPRDEDHAHPVILVPICLVVSDPDTISVTANPEWLYWFRSEDRTERITFRDVTLKLATGDAQVGWVDEDKLRFTCSSPTAVFRVVTSKVDRVLLVTQPRPARSDH
jgi:hypothetical protein